MNLKYSLAALILLCVLMASAQAETSSYGQLNYIKLPNGMNAVVMPNKAEKKVTINTIVRFGTVYENDTISGLAHILQLGIKEKLMSAIRSGKDGLSLQNTQLKTTSTSEQTYFELTTEQANVAACFRLIRDSIYKSTLSFSEIKAAISVNQIEREENLQNNRKIFEQKIQARIFRKDYERLDINGKPEKYPYFTQDRVNNYKQKYYVSGNTLFCITGNTSANLIQSILEPIFSSVYRTPFNPETVTKLIDFKPMIYSTQVVMNDAVAQPEMHLCWQFPGAISHSSASYSAHVLTAMLNDPNNYIQVKAAKLGAKRIEAIYDVNSFSGVFRLVIHAPKDQLFGVYNFVLSEILRIEKTLVNETMVQAAQLQFKRNYQFIQSTSQYPMEVVKFWPYNDEGYFQTLGDSAMNVTEGKLKRFVLEMIKESPHVSALLISESDRKELNVDSLFAETDDKINEYTFTYGPNITDPDSIQNMNKLKVLLQWLKTNTDVYIQVNGFADQGEFDKVSDNEVLAMMDTISTFRKMNPDVFKKKTFRPEMLRAMKIIRYLYINGISPDRLSGTSMTYTSNNKEEATANMKCTITLTKMRSNPSLYEYHYGQKKQ